MERFWIAGTNGENFTLGEVKKLVDDVHNDN